MSKAQFRVPDYLGHILRAIQRITRYTDVGGNFPLWDAAWL